jgi:hypothetical protein
MKRLSYANVVATLALFLAVGGGAVWAAGKIGSSGIKRNAIKSKHIAKGAVKTGDIAANAVTGAKVAENTLGQVPAASSVGGVTVTPVKVSMKTNDPVVTLLQVGTTKVAFNCNVATAGLNTTTTNASSPTVYAEYRRNPDKVVAAKLDNGPGGWASDVDSQSAYISIRENNNTVHRLTVNTYYSQNESGTNDCFADGTIETF